MLPALDPTSRILGCCLSLGDSENRFWDIHLDAEGFEETNLRKLSEGQKVEDQRGRNTQKDCYGAGYHSVQLGSATLGSPTELERIFLAIFNPVDKKLTFLTDFQLPWLRVPMGICSRAVHLDKASFCGLGRSPVAEKQEHSFAWAWNCPLQLKWIKWTQVDCRYGSRSRSASKESSWQWQPSWPKKTQTPYSLRGYRTGQTFHSVRCWWCPLSATQRKEINSESFPSCSWPSDPRAWYWCGSPRLWKTWRWEIVTMCHYT